jgi:hypothetical protein
VFTTPIAVFTMADLAVHDRPIYAFTITDLAVHDGPTRAHSLRFSARRQPEPTA